jgi:hypothetical protein
VEHLAAIEGCITRKLGHSITKRGRHKNGKKLQLEARLDLGFHGRHACHLAGFIRRNGKSYACRCPTRATIETSRCVIPQFKVDRTLPPSQEKPLLDLHSVHAPMRDRREVLLNIATVGLCIDVGILITVESAAAGVATAKQQPSSQLNKLCR